MIYFYWLSFLALTIGFFFLCVKVFEWADYSGGWRWFVFWFGLLGFAGPLYLAMVLGIINSAFPNA